MLPFELYLMLRQYAPQPIFSYVYDTSSGRMTYAGVAQKGSLKASAKWLMVKIYLNAQGRATDFRLSDENQVFNDYASLDYHASDL